MSWNPKKKLPKPIWIVAVDHDSYNYMPKKMPLKEARLYNKRNPKDQVDIYETEEACQKDCDKLNSL